MWLDKNRLPASGTRKIHGCAYLVSDSLRSPAQSGFSCPWLASRLFLSSSSVMYAIFFTIKSNKMRLFCSLRAKNTDEAQITIKKSVSHLCHTVCICVKLRTSGQTHYNLIPVRKKMATCSCGSTKTDFRYEPVAELAVERSKNLDSFAMLTRSLKAISRRNRTSRLFLSSSICKVRHFFYN